MKGEAVDEVALAGYLVELSAKLKVYEEILAKQKYVAGDVGSISLAVLYLFFTPARRNLPSQISSI